MNRLFSIALLLGLSLYPVSALAQRPEGMELKGKFVEELNLSETQKQQLQTIRQGKETEGNALKEKIRQTRQEMEQLLASGASSQDVRAKFNQLQGLSQNMAELRFEKMLAMREILTPEQRLKLKELLSQRPKRQSPQR